MSKENDIHFDLEQGWSKGLSISFLSVRSSVAIDQRKEKCLKQVHGKDLVEFSEVDAKASNTVEADGVYAQGDDFKQSRKKILIKTADCMPLVYVDRLKETVAVIHAGWKGLSQGIHLEPFRQGLCTPRDTWIWLGPCLNGKNFQVKEDMWSQFPEYCDDENYFSKDKQDPTIRYFNSWKFVEDQFRSEGVELFYNVEVDTFENKPFVSWRRAQKAGLSKLPVQNLCTVSFQK